MINYNYPVFRPPSEADSLILQVTTGCSHNKCLFCYMYKSKTFSIKPIDLIKQEIKYFSTYYSPKKAFLCDGDPLVMDTKDLIDILKTLNSYFNLNRISIYATSQNILKKKEEELKDLKDNGLSLAYIGLESGDDCVLEYMKKGSTVKEIIESVLRLKKVGIKTSVMAILGLGGKERTREHAIGTAKAISIMNPEFFSTLTLIVDTISPLYTLIREKKFKMLSEKEILLEHKTIIENIDGHNIIFRSNHASNIISIGGILSRDKNDIIKKIEYALKENNYNKNRSL